MALLIGDRAPDFTLPTKTEDGFGPISLSQFLGKKNVLILFFPMAFTTVCTSELCTINQGLAAYDSINAVVLGISGDNPYAQTIWAHEENITITLLSDYDHNVARTYEVDYKSFLPQFGLPMAGVAKRSVFIVDKFGVLQYIEILEDARELPNFAAISAKLSELV